MTLDEQDLGLTIRHVRKASEKDVHECMRFLFLNAPFDNVQLHLNADKNLDEQTGIALAKMFRAAYEAESTRQLNEDTKK